MPATISTQRLIEPSRMRGLPFHRLTALSGLLTGVAAGTSTLGHVIGFRNGDLLLDFHIARLFMQWWTTVGFTAAQEVGFEAFKATGYSVAHTVGTGAADVNLEPRGDYTANTTLVAHTAGSTAITAGTHTLAASPLLVIGGQELATGAAVVNKTIQNELVSRDRHPVDILKPNEGIVVRNRIAMGAGGVGRLLLVAEGWLKDSSP